MNTNIHPLPDELHQKIAEACRKQRAGEITEQQLCEVLKDSLTVEGLDGISIP